VQDPEWYLNEIGVKLPCAVVKGGDARISAGMSARVNHEIYFFSTPAAKRKFAADPIRWCGLVTDPVSKERFRPAKSSPRVDHAGRPYFFASDSTRAAFASDPAAFADASGQMIAMSAEMPDSTKAATKTR
jgi:YHS domain-containing protein